MSEEVDREITKQHTAAAGESFVAYKLSKLGWYVINANSGVQNMPNFDLIAMHENRSVTIQVKSAFNEKQVRLGQYKASGEYFNSKPGPKADYIAFVMLTKVGDDEVFFVPVDEANALTKELGDYYVALKIQRNSSKNFPIMCRIRGEAKKHEIERLAMGRMLSWRDNPLD